MTSSNVFIMDHPLIQHKIGYIRRKETPVKLFRDMVNEIAMLICYEATRHLMLKDVEIETPICATTVKELADHQVCLVPVLRAGLGMIDGVLNLLPSAKVGHIGLYRDPRTTQPVEYYCKLPTDVAQREVFILDPMLATGGSASAAVRLVKAKGCDRICFLSILATQVGIDRLAGDHPDVKIFVGIKDPGLNDHSYIVPGLGDAGDRIFGTS